jgi:mannose-6-phosphate isomerase-like protein (cupin superfamily)
MAEFELAPGETSVAVHHRTVEEIWYFLKGHGEMWRQAGNGEPSVVIVEPGVCISLPLGTHFQFRSDGSEALTAIGVTIPPWPGDGEAVRSDGNPEWSATVSPGPGLDEPASEPRARTVVAEADASEKRPTSEFIGREYFLDVVHELGLATARISGRYPSAGQGTWAANQAVQEMYSSWREVVDGSIRMATWAILSRIQPC